MQNMQVQRCLCPMHLVSLAIGVRHIGALLVQEAGIMAALRHPNILGEHCTWGSRPAIFVSTLYMAGISIAMETTHVGRASKRDARLNA